MPQNDYSLQLYSAMMNIFEANLGVKSNETPCLMKLTFNSEASLPFDLDVDAEVWPIGQLEGHLLWMIQGLPLLCNCTPFSLLLRILTGGHCLSYFITTTFMRVVLKYNS